MNPNKQYFLDSFASNKATANMVDKGRSANAPMPCNSIETKGDTKTVELAASNVIPISPSTVASRV